MKLFRVEGRLVPSAVVVADSGNINHDETKLAKRPQVLGLRSNVHLGVANSTFTGAETKQ